MYTQLELVEAAKKGELTGTQKEILAMGQTYSPSTHRRVIVGELNARLLFFFVLYSMIRVSNMEKVEVVAL